MSNSRKTLMQPPTATDSTADTQLETHEHAKPFPTHCLPPKVQAMARAISTTERVPETLAGVCVLGFHSASIGKGLQIQSGPERLTRGNLYILASAESGSGKSESFRHAAKPFIEIERDLLETWRTSALPQLQAEHDMLKEEIDTLKKYAKKPNSERDEIKSKLAEKIAEMEAVKLKLHAPRLSTEDVTVEQLAVMLSRRGESLASLSADAGSIVNNLLGKYNKTKRTDESIYLKSYSGDFCRVDRVSAEPVCLQSPCLSALWLTQPDKVDSLLAERSLSDGGLIPRMLICHTRCEPQPINEAPQPIPANVTAEYRALIRGLLETYRLASEPHTIFPTAEAKRALDEHFNGIVARRKTDLHDVSSYAARWNEQAWRIAVCLHAATWGKQAHEQTVELDTVKNAIALADWFAQQQLEILFGVRAKGRRAKRDEVLELLADKPEGIQASDVYRARIVSNSEAAHALLARLESEGDLTGTDSKPTGGGHVTRTFTRKKA
ncbi:MAG: DUF3987 domain-containing protein [Rhodobacteraceae bacterium]|nr:DUF3987 domain-containing protein [Paracoccaceae bacterium]